MPIRVLLADDSEIMRKAIRNLLTAETEIEIVGEAADFGQAIDMADGLKPQILIMDLHMPNRSKFTPRDIKSRLGPKAARLLAISLWSDDETKSLAASLGAATLLDKTKLGMELVPTIKQLAAVA